MFQLILLIITEYHVDNFIVKLEVLFLESNDIHELLLSIGKLFDQILILHPLLLILNLEFLNNFSEIRYGLPMLGTVGGIFTNRLVI